MNSFVTWVRRVILSPILFAAGCMPPSAPQGEEQHISKLTTADESRLNQRRDVITRHLGDSEENRRKYETAAGKLGLIRALLDSNVITPEKTDELQSAGVVLGDAFVQELGMEWIVVEDQHGRDLAIRVRGSSIILFPLTMISKRVERGEKCDVFELFNGVAEQVEQLKKQGV